MEERLKSEQDWIAIDSQGNEIMESFTDLEVWDRTCISIWNEAKGPKES